MLFLFFIIWLALGSCLAKQVADRLWPLGRINWAPALFLPLFLLALLANVFTAWLALTDWAIVAAAVLSLSAIVGLWLAWRRQPILPRVVDESGSAIAWWLWLVVYLALLLGYYLIKVSATGQALSSPWQVLPIGFILAAAILLAAAVYAIISDKKIGQTLMLIVAASLLLHSYLLVYSNGFGGDRFRHLASEERILAGREYQPTLLADQLWLVQLGPLALPQALIDSAKLSYGSQWSLEVIASKLTGIATFEINRYLLPLLWSVFLPLIVFVAAWLIRSDKKFAAWSALLAGGLYLLQYYGAQGLPASYGLLWLAFFCLWPLSYLKHRDRRLLVVSLVFLALMYFSYSLAFIGAALFLLLIAAAFYRGQWSYWASLLGVAALVALDYVSSPQLAFSVRRFYDAFIQANLFYFFSSATNYLWLNLGLIAATAILIVLVSYLAVFNKINPALKAMALWFLTLFAGYYLAWSCLLGEHSLARRLTLFACLPLVFLLADLIRRLSDYHSRWLIGGVCVAAILFIYCSGPTLAINITDSDLARARELWPQIKNQPAACVKEPLAVILALEYVSAKEFQETINNANCSLP